MQGVADPLQREGERLTLVGNGLDRHALHLGTGRVVAKGGSGGEQRLTPIAIGMKDGVDRRIHAVEQAHLVGLQRQAEIDDHRLL